MNIHHQETYAGYECVKIENEYLALWATTNVGPRIIGLEISGGKNIFASLPGITIDCPGSGEYQLRGGHRLWQAPEFPPRTYLPDDDPVTIRETLEGIQFTQPVEPQTGIEKSLRIHFQKSQPQVIIEHLLTNHGLKTIELAAWAITQLKPGGTAILPQPVSLLDDYGVLPNRQIAIWPYTEVNSPHIIWGDKFIFIDANMQKGALKIGFPNPVGWIAYLLEDVLFVKQAEYYPESEYYDFKSSSECYCNPSFLELETLGPKTKLKPGESLRHQEVWNVYGQVVASPTEQSISKLCVDLGL